MSYMQASSVPTNRAAWSDEAEAVVERCRPVIVLLVDAGRLCSGCAQIGKCLDRWQLLPPVGLAGRWSLT